MSKLDLVAIESQLKKMIQNGSSKEDCARYCFNNKVAFNKIESVLAKVREELGGVKFGRVGGSAGGWRAKVFEAFKANKKLTKKEYHAAIKSEVKNPDDYTRDHYELHAKLANL